MLNFSAGISLSDPEGSEAAATQGDIEKAWNLHYSQDLENIPGTKTLYSDVSCRILGKALERIMSKSLGEVAKEWFFEPLGMAHTMFRPDDKENCASVGVSESGRELQGEVCQDLEHYLGEVLGSDGLFSTSSDMTIFAQMLLNGGEYNGIRVLEKATVRQMCEGITNKSLFAVPTSGLEYIVSGPKTWFWEHAKAPFSFFGTQVSDKSIGKMGGAGTFLLIDPVRELTIVYLTNYGEPEQTLEGESTWNTFFRDIDMAGLCDLVITNLNL
jgi:CubicO group peptidase (beta-lactamase class C family)